jgi:uncharacterized Zn finger protein
MSWGYAWRPYVSVGERRRRAAREMERLRKKGIDIQPIALTGSKIAKTFWGAAWCEHLESYSDYANRLPRGRTYVRNGSVCHLAVSPGKVEAMVSGSEIYKVRIEIKKLPALKWRTMKQRCAGQIGSLLDLLRGKLSDNVMSVVSDREEGLFPQPKDISLDCSCPDWATMCKHVAAVLYGVGARLDQHPELLFLLRGVDHEELIAADAEAAVTSAIVRGKKRRVVAGDLSDVFGIELAADSDNADADSNARSPRETVTTKRVRRAKTAVPPPIMKKMAATKKTATTKSTETAAPRPRSSKKRTAVPPPHMTTIAKATPTGKTAAVKKSAPAGKRVKKSTSRTKAAAATKKTRS